MILATAAAVAALAAPFGELPFRTVGGAASCLRPTGAPGELARWTPRGVEFLTATADGLVLSGRATLGESTSCPEVAASTNGAGVIASAAEGGLWLALRDPGGPWSAPLRLRVPASDVAVAVSARGDAVVAWQEFGPNERMRVRAVRRRAGGLFGAPESLTGWEPGLTLSRISAVAGDDGELLVAFTRPIADTEDGAELRIAAGRPDAPFAPSMTLGRTTPFARPRLALAADGRALLAVTGIGVDTVVVYERAPGGTFGAPQSIQMRRPEDGLAIALRAGGAAAIAWRGGAVVRDGPVPFGTPVALPDARDRFVLQPVSPGSAPLDYEWPARMVLGTDGRALVAWGAAGRGVDTATVSSAGAAERVALGSPLRDAAGVTPLLLADGSRAVAWSDYAIGWSGAPSNGRVHVALEGAAGAAIAAPPRLVQGQPADRSLRRGQPLVLPMRCAAACDVRATLHGDLDVEALASRASAGTVRLRFATHGFDLAPRRQGPVKITLRWGAPGASEIARRTITVRLRRSRA